MDEFTADAFANRDEPIPMLTVTNSDEGGSASDQDSTGSGKRQQLRRSLSKTRLKGKVQALGVAQAEKHEAAGEGNLSLQDRLFAKYDDLAVYN